MSEENTLLDTIKTHQNIIEATLAEKDAEIADLKMKNENLARMLAGLMELAKPLPQTKEYLGVE
jgi:hypothetical protein